MVTAFQYSPDILQEFPNITGGIIRAQGMQGGPTQNALCQDFIAEQQATLARIGDTPLSELPSLQAWRRAFAQFGVQPTKYRSSAESLLRRLTKKGDIPTINRLVDIGNLVSIRYALPVAVVDTRVLDGWLTVHFASGSEHYTELGSDEVLHPDLGEVVFTDESSTVYARRWCWRQSAQSAAREDTTTATITIEAQHINGRESVERALQDMLALLREYAGGEFEYAVLDSSNPAI